MTKTRRAFAPDFKREAVAFLKSNNRPPIQVAAELGIQPSMLRNWRAKGSFFHTLKVELVHRCRWATRDQARRDLFAYIEGYCNRARIHSAIGYITPEQAERTASQTLSTNAGEDQAAHGPP